jgi:hypothetical protein
MATNDQLSLHAAAKHVCAVAVSGNLSSQSQILKPEYTMAGFNWHDQRGIEGIGFVRTLRTLLTNRLPKMTPDVRGILDKRFAEELRAGQKVNGKLKH